MEHKFEIGQYVMVVNWGKHFSSYYDWFAYNDCAYLEQKWYGYLQGERHLLPKGAPLRVVAIGKHQSTAYRLPLYAVQEVGTDKECIYILEESGLSPATPYEVII